MASDLLKQAIHTTGDVVHNMAVRGHATVEEYRETFECIEMGIVYDPTTTQLVGLIGKYLAAQAGVFVLDIADLMLHGGEV